MKQLQRHFNEASSAAPRVIRKPVDKGELLPRNDAETPAGISHHTAGNAIQKTEGATGCAVASLRFLTSSRQSQRRDNRLLASILDGQGMEMPSWREKIDENQARGLVAYIRFGHSMR
jgi:hypothetical protein